MKHRELQDYYLSRLFGQDYDEAERVVARMEVDNVINDILNSHDNWPFLYKQVDLVVAAGANAVALPHDFVSMVKLLSDAKPVDVVHPADYSRLITDEMRTYVASAFYNEQTPYASLGQVLPVYGSTEVRGVGTQFDGTLVGKLFQSGRDGELYPVDSVTSATSLHLKSCFVGRSQVGRVSVFPDNLTRVMGDPSLHRWSREMEGGLIWLEVNALSRRIVSVDEAEQVITVDAVNDADGDNIIYSIADTFQVEPSGNYVLNLWEISDDGGTERQLNVQYRRASTHLASDKDNPVIPFQWHGVITKGLDVRVAINDEASSSRISLLQELFNAARAEMKMKIILEYPAADGGMEPEDDPRGIGDSD